MKFKTPLIITTALALFLTPVKLSPNSNPNPIRAPKKIVSLHIKKQKSRRTSKRKYHFARLKKYSVPDEVAKLVYDKRFKIYSFAYPSRRDSKKRKPLTYKRYLKLLNPKEKAEIAFEFLVNNRVLLNEVEKVYGISPIYLAALVSVESSAGNFYGNYRIFNALYSNFLKYSIRGNRKWRNFYLNEIRSIPYLIEQGTSPFSPSSVAGAFGMTQFMPSTFRHYAVDGNNDGHINLFEREDALFSAANYLFKHGGRENIYKAFLHYNGHPWFSDALRQVIAYLNALLEKQGYELPEQQITIKIPVLLAWILTNSGRDYEIKVSNYSIKIPKVYSISSLDIMKDVVSSHDVLILHPSIEDSLTYTIKKSP